MAVRDLQDGATIAIALLVREAELRRKRDGSEDLRLVLADRTGTLPAVLWDGAAEAGGCCRVGEAVHVDGCAGGAGRLPGAGAGARLRALLGAPAVRLPARPRRAARVRAGRGRARRP